MEARRIRAEDLERILKDLLDMQAMSAGVHPHNLQLWLDLAITEARAQLDKARLKTLH